MLIYLIGMMSSGKTTIGRKLGEILKYNVIDTDELIESLENQKVKDIIESRGIEYFRKLEHDVLRNVQLDINTIISTGGGIILDKENVLFMKNNGVVVYLKTSIDTLEMRLNNTDIETRPLLKTDSLKNIYNNRKELYELACDITVICDNLSVEDICINIIKKLTL